MSIAMSIVRTLLGLLFDHTIGNIVRMIPIIRLPKLERGPVSRGFLVLLLFAVGLICIIKGGDLFVDAATWIAEVYRNCCR